MHDADPSGVYQPSKVDLMYECDLYAQTRCLESCIVTTKGIMHFAGLKELDLFVDNMLVGMQIKPIIGNSSHKATVVSCWV